MSEKALPGPETPKALPGPEEPKTQKKPRKWGPIIGIGVFVLIAILIFLYWLIWARFSISTNDAYVHGNMVEIYPQVSGNITSVNVNETFHVKEGDVLVELDPTDYLIAFENSKAQLANTVREVVKKFDTVYQLRAGLDVHKSNLIQAQLNYQHREVLVRYGAVTQEDFETSETNLMGAQASLNEALEDLKGAESQIYNTTVATHPLVLEAADSVRNAWLNLQRTIVRAPVDGYVAMKGAQVGESASASSPLMSIVPLNEVWINANFKETKLGKIRLGQEVKLISTIYGRKGEFTGKVIGISPGTGSVFSILPPQNATGNWIKIVQRIPVRVSLDPKQVEKYPLRLGLTFKAKIDIRDEEGEVLTPAMASTTPLYQTQVFQDQIYGVEPIIQQVIQDNINSNCGAP